MKPLQSYTVEQFLQISLLYGHFLHCVADAMEMVTRTGSQNITESAFVYSK